MRSRPLGRKIGAGGTRFRAAGMTFGVRGIRLRAERSGHRSEGARSADDGAERRGKGALHAHRRTKLGARGTLPGVGDAKRRATPTNRGIVTMTSGGTAKTRLPAGCGPHACGADCMPAKAGTCVQMNGSQATCNGYMP
jgi:hypothetical protein